MPICAMFCSHKPRGYVTTCQDEQHRRTVFDLFKRQPVRLFPVGRLDVNSEGVLLLTNEAEAWRAVYCTCVTAIRQE